MDATPATPKPMEDRQLLLFKVMHRSMREDAAALVAAIGSLPTDDRRTARTIDAWFRRFATAIVHHHEVEDEIFWPALVSRSPQFGPAQGELHADHVRLDEAMDVVTEALAELVRGDHPFDDARDGAVAAATDLDTVLRDHLEREEAVAFPLFLAGFSADEFDAISREAERMAPVRSLTWTFPWALDHATAVETASARPPLPLRIVNRAVWQPRYRRSAAPVRRARAAQLAGRRPAGTRRSRAGVAAAAVALVAMLAVLPSCGADDPAASEAGVPAAPPARQLDVTATDFTFEPSASRVAAGPVPVRLINKGSEAHQVHLAKARPGVTVERIMHAFHEGGDAATSTLIDYRGGVGALEPGAEQTVTTDLEAGDYFMICFVPSPGGTSHVMKEMVVPLKVVDTDEAASASAPEPPPDTPTIGLRDYAVDMPAGFTGKGPVVLRNTGKEQHELVLMRFKPNRTIADLVAWQNAKFTGEPPIVWAGGIGAIQPGATARTTFDLEPGTYVGLCVLPAPNGAPHVEMGMFTTFTVPPGG